MAKFSFIFLFFFTIIHGVFPQPIDSLQKLLLNPPHDTLRIAMAHNNIGLLHLKIGNYEEALSFFLDARAIYNLEKQEAEMEILSKDAQLTEMELQRQRERQRTTRNAFLAGILVLLVISGFVYNRYRLKKKANDLLAEKNVIIAQEKQKSDDLLLNILPAETAEELKQNGKANARSYEQVTVLFADIKGFTNIAEKLSPEELVSHLHRYFKAFDSIVETYGLEKIKTIGDAYMCAGGIPVPNAHHPVDVVKAALEMQKTVEMLSKDEDLPALQVRLGIHTGPVVSGVVGSKKFAYDIWGDTVNIAARMEQSGEVGKVNISAHTYNLVKDQFQCFHRGKIAAKNKGEVDMFIVQ